MPVEIHKGQLLVVKTPPYYEKTYFYQVLSAGDKQIRAALYHSPKVRKGWTKEEFDLLVELGMVRVAEKDELPTDG